MNNRESGRHGHLKSRLAKTRQMMSLIEKDIVSVSNEITQTSENWVPMWIDNGHCITSDCGLLRAYRGISFKGEMMWLVRHESKKHGYHADPDCPFEAFDEAQAAWKRCAHVRAEWPEVRQIARDLIKGTLKFTVTRQDAYASPLCRAGVDGFMASIGMSRVQNVNGRAAALLMRVDPQMGFAIREAHRRHMREIRAQTARGLQTQST